MRKQVETERTARRALEEEVLRQQKRLEQVRAEHDTALEKLQDAAKRVSQLESVQAVQQRAALSSSYSAGSSPDRDFGPTSSSAARSRTALTFTGVTQTELAGGHIDGLRQELADVRQQLDTGMHTFRGTKLVILVASCIVYSVYYTRIVLARNRELERTLRTLETTHIEVSSKTSTLQSQMETLRGENESLQLRLDLKDRQNISAEVDLKQANLRCGTLQTDVCFCLVILRVIFIQFSYVFIHNVYLCIIHNVFVYTRNVTYIKLVALYCSWRSCSRSCSAPPTSCA